MNIPPCRYEIGQHVEVLMNNFEVPGFPEQWFPGEVIKVEVMNAERGLWDVMVLAERGTYTAYSPQIVGPRGGNKRIRAASA